MRYVLRFLPEVEDDVLAGYAWYQEKAPGIGEEFLRMFYAGAGQILRNALLFRKVDREFRRCLLRRFPYAIYFTLQDNEIVVFGFFHCARDPRMVKAKLRDRSD
jgi:hypothetical protein